MNPIQQLEQGVRDRFPTAQFALDPPEKPEASWFLDIDLDGHRVNVEWRSHCGFGVTANPETGYGEGADELYPDFCSAQQRVLALLLARTKTSPPSVVTLEGLRRTRRVTQSQLARQLGVRQPAIAKLEKRSDLHVSTLHQVVAAMGGRLSIRACFPDGMEKEIVFSDLAEVDTDSTGPSTAVTEPQSAAGKSSHRA